MKKNDPRANNTLLLSGLVFLLLASMLWKIVSAYLKGGSNAPSTAVLIAGILVLGGGMVFSAVIAYRRIAGGFHSFEGSDAERRREVPEDQQPEIRP